MLHAFLLDVGFLRKYQSVVEKVKARNLCQGELVCYGSTQYYSSMTVPHPIKRHLISICRLIATRCPGIIATGFRSAKVV